ncbi:hypothetical protein D9M68_1005220 [compost metagenome]
MRAKLSDSVQLPIMALVMAGEAGAVPTEKLPPVKTRWPVVGSTWLLVVAMPLVP